MDKKKFDCVLAYKDFCDELRLRSDTIKDPFKEFSNWLSQEVEMEVQKTEILSLENEEYDRTYTIKEMVQRINKYLR